MAEQTYETPSITPSLMGLRLAEARRLAKKRSQATVEFKLVDSEEKALTVVRQYPEAGDELSPSRVIKVEIATRPLDQLPARHLPGFGRGKRRLPPALPAIPRT